MIHTQLREEMIKAMKARQALRLSVLRGLLSSFTNEAVSKGRKPDADLTDEEAMAVIKRAGKQRKDSIEQFEKGGRADLAEKEQAELQIISEYLPEEMSREEIEKMAKMKIEELGIKDKAGAGKLTGALMKELGGRADGTLVREVIEKLLS
jgi:hypothetical protein